MTALAELAPAEQHQAVAAGFTRVARQVTDWDAPTPVAQWRARDVVGHLVEWLPGFLEGGGISLAIEPAADDGDPALVWDRHVLAVQSLLDDPAVAERIFERPYVPAQPLAQAISSFYTVDVFMHTWDLGRSAGLDVTLDDALCTQLVEGMAGMEELLRSSGQYGPAVPVPADADPQARLIGFIGRDPDWQPPTTPPTR